MTDRAFFNGLTKSKEDILQRLLNILLQEEIEYCLIGGLAVNAYVEPIVSLDFDIVVAADKLETLKRVASQFVAIKEFPHSLNFYSSNSDLRIQIQTDERYRPFIDRAETRVVLGYELRVASVEDVLQGKIWAYLDESRRKSKRQKDLADIFRIIEQFPNLVGQLPNDIQRQL